MNIISNLIPLTTIFHLLFIDVIGYFILKFGCNLSIGRRDMAKSRWVLACQTSDGRRHGGDGRGATSRNLLKSCRQITHANPAETICFSIKKNGFCRICLQDLHAGFWGHSGSFLEAFWKSRTNPRPKSRTQKSINLRHTKNTTIMMVIWRS